MKILKNKYFQLAIVILSYVVISFMYLYPGGSLLLTDNKEYAMSDGTDPTAAPYAYGYVKYAFNNHPELLLYGALPVKTFNGPEGMAAWYFWHEKILGVIATHLVSLEQTPTLIAWFGYVLDALAFYIMGLLLGWKKPVSFAGGLCWAICAYTRGRAKVHMALVSTYFLPMMMIGFILLKRNKTKKDFYWAAFAFLMTAMSAQYYVILSAAMSPFFLYYYFANSGSNKYFSKESQDYKKLLVKLVLAALPSIGLLTWTLLVPVPAGSLSVQAVYPKTGEAPVDQIHPFLNRFAAKPIDYIAGDVAIGLKDLNPLRYMASRSIVENLDGSNYHERANGIRWSIFVFAALAIYGFRKKREMGFSKHTLNALLAIVLVGFVLSLGPTWFGFNIGPALWLNKLVSQFRVSNRAGLFVNFGLLVLACYYVSSLKAKKWLWLFPLIAILELPPFLNAMPISHIQPEYKSLTKYTKDDQCGLGLYYPYISGQWQTMSYYIFLQRTRGSLCPAVNAASLIDREIPMINYFPLHSEYVKLIMANDPRPKQQLQHFAKCASLSWVVFDRVVPLEWRDEVCRSLGWTMTEPEVCQASKMQPYPAVFNSQCIGTPK